MSSRRPRRLLSGPVMVAALATIVGSTMPVPDGAIGTVWAEPLGLPGACSAAWMGEPVEPPAYYAIELVSTRRVPGARDASGVGNGSFARSPVGVAIAPTGEYIYNVDVQLRGLNAQPRGVYTAWLTTASLDQVRRLGALDAGAAIRGQTTWNKFLVVVTLEPDDEARPRWSGPIVARGMSRSGRMHTMAGHGPFQLEPCTTYGY